MKRIGRRLVIADYVRNDKDWIHVIPLNFNPVGIGIFNRTHIVANQPVKDTFLLTLANGQREWEAKQIVYMMMVFYDTRASMTFPKASECGQKVRWIRAAL